MNRSTETYVLKFHRRWCNEPPMSCCRRGRKLREQRVDWKLGRFQLECSYEHHIHESAQASAITCKLALSTHCPTHRFNITLPHSPLGHRRSNLLPKTPGSSSSYTSVIDPGKAERSFDMGRLGDRRWSASQVPGGICWLASVACAGGNSTETLAEAVGAKDLRISYQGFAP